MTAPNNPAPAGETTPYRRALTLYELRRYADAEGELRRALAREPGHSAAHALLSLAVVNQSGPDGLPPARLEEALREARQAIRLRPEDEFGYIALACACLAGRKPDEALRAAAQVLRIDPRSFSGWALTSDGWAQKREWEKALQAAEAGLAIDPQSAGLHNNRSHALIMLGRENEARDSTAQALALDPQSDAAHTNRGWLALLGGEHAAALPHFRQALRLDPLNEPARRGFLAALQSRNPLLRLLVRYSLWMARFTRAESLVVSYSLASVSSVLGMAAQACCPLYLLYLPWRLFYSAFIFFSWVSDAFFYLLLRYNRGGRLLLSKEELAESTALALCLITFFANLGAFLANRAWGFAGSGGGIFGHAWGFLAGMALGLFMIIPSAAVFRMPRRARTRRAVLAGLVALLLATGLSSQGLAFLPSPWALVPGVFFFLGAFSLPLITNLLLLLFD